MEVKADLEEEVVLPPTSQMAIAVQIAARKIELLPKAKSGFEMFTCIQLEKEVKKNKSVKRAAKKMVKKKEIKKISSYFLTK
jgi:hypothetical protein